MNTIRVTNLISRIRQGSKKATVMVPLRLTVSRNEAVQESMQSRTNAGFTCPWHGTHSIPVFSLNTR